MALYSMKTMLLYGNGAYKYADGGVYDGDWKDGMRHGKGTYKWADGELYEGDWKAGKKHGKGTITYANGNKYEGDYVDGKQHGKGTFKWTDGDVYEGDWKDGKRHGKGTYKWACGNVYEGRWKDGKRRGKGIYKYAETMDLATREKNMQELSKTVLIKTMGFESANLCYYSDPLGEKLRRIRSLYLLLLRNRFKLTAPQFMTDANNNVREIPLECPANRDWKMAKMAFYNALDVKQYIRETIPEGTRTKYYNPRLLIVTLTKWQKYIHEIVLNDAISYYQKVPSQLPTEVKSRIVSYLITPYILPHL